MECDESRSETPEERPRKSLTGNGLMAAFLLLFVAGIPKAVLHFAKNVSETENRRQAERARNSAQLEKAFKRTEVMVALSRFQQEFDLTDDEVDALLEAEWLEANGAKELAPWQVENKNWHWNASWNLESVRQRFDDFAGTRAQRSNPDPTAHR